MSTIVKSLAMKNIESDGLPSHRGGCCKHSGSHNGVSMRVSMRSAHKPRINRPTADRRQLLHHSRIAPSASEAGAMPSEADAIGPETDAMMFSRLAPFAHSGGQFSLQPLTFSLSP